MYFFTGDQHFGHGNIRTYCARPFSSTEEMDSEIIKRHNEVVKKEDIVIHAGDFTFKKSYQETLKYVHQLNGQNIFLIGSHDSWLKGTTAHPYIWEKMIEDVYVVVCHYAMRVWPRSHYNSWCLYGHSHGRLDPVGKSYDVGVDNKENNFYPVSFNQLKIIMAKQPDNFNYIGNKNHEIY